MRSGIYFIIHIRSGRAYVGQASNIYHRWSYHRSALDKGYHHCKYLQRLWNKYGRSAFVFRVVEFCEVVFLDQRECFWYGKLKSKYKLINIHPPGKQARGFKVSKETKDKIRMAQLRLCESEEERQRRSDRAKNQHLEGRIGKRNKLVKYRECLNCRDKFRVPRVTAGGFSNTKWCDSCRPPHRGGRYKTANRLPVGVNESYRKGGIPIGFSHSEETKKKIAIASKAMWKRRKYNRVLLEEGRPKQTYSGKD